MQLEIKILSGNRHGEVLHIEKFVSSTSISLWVKENEVLEMRFEMEGVYFDATLLLNDHEIETTEVIAEEKRTIFIWKPKRRRREGYECLFFNYFGIAEFSVKLLNTENGIPEYIKFLPIEVLASKYNARNVENMLEYLANLDDDELHSVFQTTKYNAGFKSGLNSPESNLERIEYTFQLINSVLPEIIKHPITKLLPVQKIITPNEDDDFDDSTLGWLMSNLSEINECNDLYQSHLKYGSKMYRASSLQVSELEENPNIYENWVIHGFINSLILEITKQLNSYEILLPNKSIDYGVKSEGYLSFFDQVNKFRRRLLSNQLSRCKTLLNSARKLKFHLVKYLPVNKTLIQRPMLTPKAASNIAYRTIFKEFINWLEKSSPDWTVYEDLFSIKSIPILFESYSYYRVAEVLSKHFKSNKRIGAYWEDTFGNEVTLFREPIYWMNGNRNTNKLDDYFINTEGLIIRDDKIRERSRNHKYSHRRPDIVIEIKNNNNQRILQVLDAKYTTDKLAFKHYLPECTMKYVHGIHSKGTGKTVVNSMTILFPSDKGNLYCFHSDEHDVLSVNPITPSLQCVGLTLDKYNHKDNLEKVIKGILMNVMPNDCTTQDYELDVII